VIDSSTRGEALLDVFLTNMDKLNRHVKLCSSLGCSDHDLVESTILRHTGQVKTRVRTLNYRRANFQLFKELAYGTSGKLPSEIKKLNRAGSSFRTYFLEHKSSRSPCVRNQEGKARHQHG